jgi:hypothetical protein
MYVPAARLTSQLTVYDSVHAFGLPALRHLLSLCTALQSQVRINASRSRALSLLYIVTQSLPVRGSFVYLMYTVRSWFLGPSVNPWIGLVRQSTKTRNSPSSTLVRPRCSPRALPR